MNVHDFLFWLVSLGSLSPKKRTQLWQLGYQLTDDDRAKLVYTLSRQGKVQAPNQLLIDQLKSQQYVSILDDHYPRLLKEIAQPPLVLFYRGDISLLKQKSVAIVGSRKHTSYGAMLIQRWIPEIVKKDIVTISGAAIGVDGLVHRTTLAAKGKTIAVLGHGFSHAYPKEHYGLLHMIAKQGLVVTEYAPWMAPKSWRFPERNRIVVGLTQDVWVVEAQCNSGSLVSANIALDENREVWCVPGDISRTQSQGTNQLFQDGANVLLDVFLLVESIEKADG